MKLLITCENATNHIPEEYFSAFDNPKGERNLKSNRAFDTGAAELYEHLVAELKPDFSAKTEVSKLLIDVNRAITHIRLFSVFAQKLSPEELEEITEKYYNEYRGNITRFIEQQVGAGDLVIHLSVSSFEHVHRGLERDGDIGILYDTQQIDEREFAAPIKVFLSKRGVKARTNYPIQGRADSFTTQLRKMFENYYLGIDLTVNQKLAVTGGKDWDKLKKDLVDVVKIALKLQEDSFSNQKLY
jgi:predicted N-formylglutamate amidohydrolase